MKFNFTFKSASIWIMMERFQGNHKEKVKSLIGKDFFAYWISCFVRSRMGRDLTPEGRQLFLKYMVMICQDKKISPSRDVPPVYQGAKLSIFVEGQENIPTSGPTLFIGNHTRGGPLDSMGQFFELAKQGYEARTQVQDPYIREPFMIMQRGVGKNVAVRYISGILYELAASTFNFEVVNIPEFDEEGEIVNFQGIPLSMIRRVKRGGAMLCYPQGRHREPNDFQFPKRAGDKLLEAINRNCPQALLIGVRAIPDSQGNMRLFLGEPIEAGEVVDRGGIEYFAKAHISCLGRPLGF